MTDRASAHALVERLEQAANITDPDVALRKLSQLAIEAAALLREARPSNDHVQAGAMLEAIQDMLAGEDVSDFMLSFDVIRRVDDLRTDNANLRHRLMLEIEANKPLPAPPSSRPAPQEQ